MNNLIKKRQDNQPAAFGRAIDDIFQNNLTRFFTDDLWGYDGSGTSKQVPVNIEETERSYIIELIAPGLEKKDLRLNIADDTLTVSFEHSEETKQENKKWLTRQYKSQAFYKTFSLDKTIDTEKITANYENGILKITVPKSEHAQKIARTIQIQ